MVNHGTASNPLTSLSAYLSEMYADSDKIYYVQPGASVTLTGKTTYPSYTATLTTGGSGITCDSSTGTASGTMPSSDVNVVCSYHYSSQGMGETWTIKLVTAGSTGPYAITTNAGTGGSISPTSASVAAGGSQTFNVAADSGYYIYAVYVDGNTVHTSTTDTTYSYTFTNVNETHYIAATFYAFPGSTITASAGTGGSISPSGSVSVNHGANKSFTISADSAYKISTIKVDGSNISGVSGRSSYTYTFTNVTTDHTIAATFYYDPPTVNYTITASATTGGTISPNGTVSVESGSSKTFTATPSSGYRLSYWNVDGANGGSNLTYTFTNVTTTHTIQAVFVKTYVVTAVAPQHGSVTISATGYTPQTASAGGIATLTVDTGTSVNFACTMDTGYNFSAWTEGGSTVSNNPSYTVSITANRNLTATETAGSYVITATSTTGGSISPSGEVTVAHGGSQTFTATADTGYRFDHWIVDGQEEGDN